MKNKMTSIKNFVARNQTKILTTALVVTTTIAVVEQIGVREHNQFLKDHDLYEAYYTPEEETQEA